MAATASSLSLGVRLGEFELIGVLGEGGFSVVYVAVDHSLERTVAIKEYIPGSLAARQPDGQVMPRSPKHEDTFKAGLVSFINEAKLLARFNHPALIHIHRVWEQNGTAYMAMQYCHGRTLRQVVQTEPALIKNESWIKATFVPILDALELLHANNCFHRDISPENILLLQNGAPILLDFGAARHVIGDMTQALTVILKPGFAPIEQYADDSSLEQGAWTDVYGVGAVLYFLLMGKPPVASVARLVKDPMVKLASVSDLDWLSPAFREGIDRALAVYPKQRIGSIAELRDALQLPTFKPDSQFGGLFSIPSSVVPKTVSGEAVFHTLPGTQPGAVPPNDQKAERGPLTPDASPTSRKAASRTISVTLPATDLQQWKAWAAKLPWPLLAGVSGIVALAVAAVLLINPENKPDHPKSVAANSSTSGQKSSSTAEREPPQIPSALNIPASPAEAKSSAPEKIAPEEGTVTPAQKSAPGASKTVSTIVRPDSSAKGAPTETFPISVPAKLPASSAKNTAVSSAPASMPSTSVTPASAPISTANGQPSKPASSPSSGPEANQLKTNKPSESGSAAQTQTVLAANEHPAPQASAPAEKASARSQSLSRVTFSIRPWGYVIVDGQLKGSSPPLTRLDLPRGLHTVVITNNNFPPVTKEISVTDKNDLVISHRFGNE